MEKYRRYYGVLALVAGVSFLIWLAYNIISPKVIEIFDTKETIKTKQTQLSNEESKLRIVQNKIKKIKN